MSGRAEIVELLRRAGVDAYRTPEGGIAPERGEIPLPESTRAVITSLAEEDITPPHIRAANDAPGLTERLWSLRERVWVRRILPCFEALPCFLQPGCCEVKRSWVPPDIRMDPPIPTRIPYVKFCLNPFGAGVTGDVEVTSVNRSKEGEEIVRTACRCSGGSSKETRAFVPGSALIDTNQFQEVVMKDIGERLERFAQNLRGMRPEVAVTTKASFRKKGIIDLIRSMWDRFRSGGLKIKADIESTITWTWLGKRNTKVLRWAVEAWVPVAKVEYDVTCRV